MIIKNRRVRLAAAIVIAVIMAVALSVWVLGRVVCQIPQIRL